MVCHGTGTIIEVMNWPPMPGDAGDATVSVWRSELISVCCVTFIRISVLYLPKVQEILNNRYKHALIFE